MNTANNNIKSLSVVVPMYNISKYIIKCIESIVGQNIPEEELDILLINDGSTDDTLYMAENLAKQYSNITVINQENKGLGGARNTGIKNATGKYILFLDADDWFTKNSVRQLIHIANDNNLEILEFGAQGITTQGEVKYKRGSSSNGRVYSGLEYKKKIKSMESACNKLYLKSFLVHESIFFLERIYIEDYEFNTRAFLKAQKVMAIDSIVSNFLQSDNSITRNNDKRKREKMISDVIFVLEETNRMYKKDSNTYAKDYLLERLCYLVATLFFLIIKFRLPYSYFLMTIQQIKEKRLFYTDHKINDSYKNLFRILIIKNLRFLPSIKT